MQVRVLSDLHLEGQFFGYEWLQEDVLILAGDISTAKYHGVFESFLNNVPTATTILFVPGNHEFYNGIFEEEIDYFKQLETVYENFIFMNNKGIVINGVCYFGGTMFTDFLLYGEVDSIRAKQEAQHYVYDFKVIKKADGSKWTVKDHCEQFKIFFKDFKYWLKLTEGQKRVVITHYAPSDMITADRFVGSSMNPYFTQNMERYFGMVDYWVYGHHHNSTDRVINDTRLICNPRGYGNENLAGFNRNLILEI